MNQLDHAMSFSRYLPLLFLISALSTWVGCQRTAPAETFQIATKRRVTSSVNIINSRSRVGNEVEHYLHFKISPDDFASIVQGGGYDRDEKPTLDFHLWKDRPSWWTPEKLGSGAVVQYIRTVEEGGNVWTRMLFVNAATNEVYCVAAPLLR
jgi:hypothetical protein